MGDFMRLIRCLLVSGSAAMLAGGMMLTAGSAATTSAAPAARAAQSASHPSARFLAEARSALVSYLKHNHQPLLPTHGSAHVGPVGTSAVSSFNWSGYAATSATTGTFSEVSGEWKTPAVSCSVEDTITSEWVGRDGCRAATVGGGGNLRGGS